MKEAVRSVNEESRNLIIYGIKETKECECEDVLHVDTLPDFSFFCFQIIFAEAGCDFFLYHVAIPTDVSLLSLSRRRSRAAALQRMTNFSDTYKQ